MSVYELEFEAEAFGMECYVDGNDLCLLVHLGERLQRRWSYVTKIVRLQTWSQLEAWL